MTKVSWRFVVVEDLVFSSSGVSPFLFRPPARWLFPVKLVRFSGFAIIRATVGRALTSLGIYH